MPTSNETVRDALIRHQVNLQRLSAGMSNQVIRLLDETEDSIVADIREQLRKGATTETTAGLRKLEHLEDLVKQIRHGAISTTEDLVADLSYGVVRHEAEFSASALDAASPTELDLDTPAASTLAALVKEPFEGHTLSTWFDRVAEADSQRIMDAVRLGLTRGEDIDTIVRRVVGTSSVIGQDGATQLTRQNIDSLVRTAVNHYSNRARSLTFEQNKDVIHSEVYVATLDARTSAICRSLDGKVYPVGEGKFPPQHFRCRSIRVPTLDGKLVGDRPMKPVTEKMLLKEFNDLNPGSDAKKRADLARGLKGEFDDYAKKRIREMVGTVPASTTYNEWLKRQSADFQDEILGKSKAKLFRSGGLSLDKYVGRDGTELSLAQLAKNNKAAFKKAGIDPAKYQVE